MCPPFFVTRRGHRCPQGGVPKGGDSAELRPRSRCWERNEKAAVWWIIRCPILMAVAVGDTGTGG